MGPHSRAGRVVPRLRKTRQALMALSRVSRLLDSTLGRYWQKRGWTRRMTLRCVQKRWEIRIAYGWSVSFMHVLANCRLPSPCTESHARSVLHCRCPAGGPRILCGSRPR